MQMKIFSAFLGTETNTAAVVPTGAADFERDAFYRGNASTLDPAGFGAFHAELMRLAALDGHAVTESLTAFAQPAGPTARAVYERYRDWILDDLQDACPVDAIVLILHGAMVADGYDDCEGDLLQRVRAIVGADIPIGVELDLHCHFTELMRSNADIIICYKEYPHIDGLLRLREVYQHVTAQAQKSIRPVTAVRDLGMIGLWHTTREPMRSFVQRMQSFEGRDGVLSVSLGHGFPWGDVPDCGAKLWVVTDADENKARLLADQLGDEFWNLRGESSQPPATIAQAIEAIGASAAGPIVLADVADNAGGGAMSDSTFLLKALIDAGVSDTVIGSFWDPGAVALCLSAGVGAQLSLRIGGKCGPLSGNPVDVFVTIKAIVEDHGQHGLNQRWPLGTGVWVRTGSGIDIALNTIRSQVLSAEIFEGLGIPLRQRKAIVVKSAQHFHAAFASFAARIIYVGAPGSASQDFANMSFQKRGNNFWPRVDRQPVTLPNAAVSKPESVAP
jgi:microcystin degradation protein MlrC